jgi:hypothetical protein
MASRIYFSFLDRTIVGCLIATLALQDCLELALEELDLLELLRGRSFSLRAFVLKKLNVLSIHSNDYKAVICTPADRSGAVQ